ncbi:hypothetical protein [Candidatus Cetobacterium colombiensis]|uniref:Uncharacterized protein n=1 Tax=Candidatus Cetobacterium colombiensis TaxID=3073100 RepID=A0ABU4WD95_9FUSO|nr:hypothetical protein [Candidatus Cetobacterium colombiensis]MDX8337516.1 hypothetical protein [Candidatus Cetobacterium colombiensis]
MAEIAAGREAALLTPKLLRIMTDNMSFNFTVIKRKKVKGRRDPRIADWTV